MSEMNDLKQQLREDALYLRALEQNPRCAEWDIASRIEAALADRIAELESLLTEAADEMEESCQNEGRLSSFMSLSKRIRAALQEGER